MARSTCRAALVSEWRVAVGMPTMLSVPLMPAMATSWKKSLQVKMSSTASAWRCFRPGSRLRHAGSPKRKTPRRRRTCPPASGPWQWRGGRPHLSTGIPRVAVLVRTAGKEGRGGQCRRGIASLGTTPATIWVWVPGVGEPLGIPVRVDAGPPPHVGPHMAPSPCAWRGGTVVAGDSDPAAGGRGWMGTPESPDPDMSSPCGGHGCPRARPRSEDDGRRTC